jgi:hypothetical protein
MSLNNITQLIHHNDVKAIENLTLSVNDVMSFHITQYPINEALLAFIDKVDLNLLNHEQKGQFLAPILYYQYMSQTPEKEQEQQKLYTSASKLLNQMAFKDFFEFFKILEGVSDEAMECLTINQNHELFDRLGLETFKYKMLNWEKIVMMQTVYFEPHEKKERQEFQDKLKEKISSIHSKDDLITFLTQGAWAELMNELKTKKVYETIKKNQTAYLDSDIEADQIRFLDNLALDLNQETYTKKITKIINPHLKNQVNSLQNEDIFNQISHVGFSSISFFKDSNPVAIVDFIQAGCKKIRDIFGLDENHSIGHNNLTLHFSYLTPSGILAGYTPKNESIIVNNNHLDDVMNYFIHEYTHYLQDKAVNLTDASYQKHVPNKFKAFKEWSEIEHILRSEQKPSIDKLINLFITNHKPKRVANESLAFFSGNAIETDELGQKLNLIEAKIKDLFNGIITFKELKKELHNSDLFNDKERTRYLQDIKELYTSYQDKSFEMSLWKKFDQKRHRFYYQKNFEIHARLVEQTVSLKNYYEVGEEKMERIKPILTQFNHLLASLAQDMIELKKENKIESIHLNDKIKQYRKAQTQSIKNDVSDSTNLTHSK